MGSVGSRGLWGWALIGNRTGKLPLPETAGWPVLASTAPKSQTSQKYFFSILSHQDWSPIKTSSSPYQEKKAFITVLKNTININRKFEK